jgi:hypothetical protein
VLFLNQRKSRFATAAILGIVGFAIVASGCGSGDSEPLTKADFAKQANAICAKAEEERNKGSKELADKEVASPEEAEVASEALLGPVSTMTEELGELGPPKGDEKQVEAIISAFEAGLAKLEAEPTSERSAFAFAKANELALDFGLTSCTI